MVPNDFKKLNADAMSFFQHVIMSTCRKIHNEKEGVC